MALRGLLDLTSYYWRFVKNCGLIARPFIVMLKKDNFEWTDVVKKAFNDLRRAMAHTLVLALPNFEKPFEIYTYMSGDGIKVYYDKKRGVQLLFPKLWSI